MAAHRYWRVKINTYYGVAIRIATIALFDGSNVNQATTDNGTASASVSDAGAAANAFDASTATLWGSVAPYAGMWVQWDFGFDNAREVLKVALTNSSYTTYSPNACELQYSDDGATFTTALSFSNPTTNLVVTTTFVPGAATASLQCPIASLTAYTGTNAELYAPAGSLVSNGGSVANLTAPSPTLYAIGHDSTGENAAHLTAPRPALMFYGGALAKLTAPMQALSASATVGNMASAALTAPSPVVAASATVGGVANATLKAPRPNLVGYGGAVCHITLTGRPTVQASATVGAVASAAITCPLFELTASATKGDTATAHLIAPSPRMGATAQAWLVAPMGKLTAIGSAVITATYEAYAVNLKHTPRGNEQPTDETTRYTNFPFTHVVRYQNSYYGANSTGLYLLEGTTDDGTPIPWAIETALTDFKTPNKKTLASAYFSGRFGPASTIKLIEGEKTPNTYSFSTPRGTLAQNHRQKFGKGAKGRYYALAASGTGTLELDGIECEVHQLTRRI